MSAKKDAPVTLRDYFAGKALQALIAAGPECRKQTAEGLLIVSGREGYSQLAYEYADQMMKARDA